MTIGERPQPREYDFPVDWVLERAFDKVARAYAIAYPEYGPPEIAKDRLELTKVDGPDLTEPARYLVRVSPRD